MFRANQISPSAIGFLMVKVFVSLGVVTFLLLASNARAADHSVDLEKNSSQYFKISDAAQTGLDITGDMTVEAWIKLESLPTYNTWYRIVTKYNGSTGNQRSWQFSLNHGISGYGLEFQTISDGTVGTRIEKTVNYNFQVGKWYHVAVAFDASAGAAEFFIDGVSYGTKTGYNTSIFNSTADLQIGATEGLDNFDGVIDEVRIWDDVRSSSEIANNMLSTLIGSESNLVAYWKFDGVGLDETSNSNDLTNVNSASFTAELPYQSNLIITVNSLDYSFSGTLNELIAELLGF